MRYMSRGALRRRVRGTYVPGVFKRLKRRGGFIRKYFKR